MTHTITLTPGESITITAAPNKQGQPDAPPTLRHILAVPWLSQHSPTASLAPGDCGPACIAMAVRFLTDKEPSVDQVTQAASVPQGAKWSSLHQLAKGARSYGLKVTHVRPLTLVRIHREIKAGFPVLALVKYNLLSTGDDPNQDPYTGAHFVLIIGMTKPTIIFHDPNRLSGNTFGESRETTWSLFLNALSSTSQTPGNSYDRHGMTFDV